MSKPQIEFKLRWWEIAYQVKPFNLDDRTEHHYQAELSYIAKSSDRTLTHNDRKTFATFDEAKKYIDQELAA